MEHSITVYNSYSDVKGRVLTLSLDVLLSVLGKSKSSGCTVSEWEKMESPERARAKDRGAFTVAKSKDGSRKAESLEQTATLIVLDIDKNDFTFDEVVTLFELEVGVRALLHPTLSYTEDNHKMRIIIPLGFTISSTDYPKLAMAIAQKTGVEVDEASYRFTQCWNWFTQFEDSTRKAVDTGAHGYKTPLSQDQAKRLMETVPKGAEALGLDSHEDRAAVLRDPTTLDGIPGWFNRTYGIREAIATFLPHVYEWDTKVKRFKHVGSKSTPGVTLYEDSGYALSYHTESDICAGTPMHAYQIVSRHLYPKLDGATKATTKPHKYPSWEEFERYLMRTPELKAKFVSELVYADEPEVDDYTKEDTAWLNPFIDAKGNKKFGIDFMLAALRNDPKLKGRLFFDVFQGDGGYTDDTGTTLWLKFSGDKVKTIVKARLQTKYGYTSPPDSDINNCIALVAEDTERNFMAEILDNLPVWDGVERVERTFIDIFDVKDRPSTREAARLMFAQGVATAYVPGCAIEGFIPVLYAPAGIGKSTFCKQLAMVGDPVCRGLNLYAPTVKSYSLSNPDALNDICGKWIVEMGELSRIERDTIEDIKQFVTSRSHTYRSPYYRDRSERRFGHIYVGTTNKEQFMPINSDDGMHRRFMGLTSNTVEPDEVTERVLNMDAKQYWAEAVFWYKNGDPRAFPHKNIDLKVAMTDEAKGFQQIDSRFEKLLDVLEILVPEYWDSMALAQRRYYIDRVSRNMPVPWMGDHYLKTFTLVEVYEALGGDVIRDGVFKSRLSTLERTITDYRREEGGPPVFEVVKTTSGKPRDRRAKIGGAARARVLVFERLDDTVPDDLRAHHEALATAWYSNPEQAVPIGVIDEKGSLAGAVDMTTLDGILSGDIPEPRMKGDIDNEEGLVVQEGDADDKWGDQVDFGSSDLYQGVVSDNLPGVQRLEEDVTDREAGVCDELSGRGDAVSHAEGIQNEDFTTGSNGASRNQSLEYFEREFAQAFASESIDGGQWGNGCLPETDTDDVWGDGWEDA